MAQKPLQPAKQIIAPGKDIALPRSFYKDDFPLIRKASIFLGASIAVSAALLAGSGLLLSKQQSNRTTAQTHLDQALGQYKQSENERNEIRDFQPRYEQLLQRGFVGEENRLDTVEYIRHIQEDRKLLPIFYEIAPQQPLPVDPSVQTDELELRISKITFHMELLHEMDLFNLLSDLSAKGLFAPQVCSIRASDSASDIKLAPQLLRSECTLNWITMGRRTAAEGEAPKAPAQ
jgi:hypothetical protein